MNNAGDDLRKKYEAMLGEAAGPVSANLSSDDMQKLWHELQLRQIELELRNEELQKSNHELMVSRDRYAHLYNSSPIGYLTLNQKGTIQKLNPAAVQLLGASDKNLINKELVQFINPSDQNSYYLFFKKILTASDDQSIHVRLNCINTNLGSFECKGMNCFDCFPEFCICKDGFIFVECRGACEVTENGDSQVYMTIVNITENKKALQTIACLNEKMERKIFQQTNVLTETNKELTQKIEQLRFYKNHTLEREAMLNAIFNAAAEGIITIKITGKIVYVNHGVENIFCYEREELINININNIIPLTQNKINLRQICRDSGMELSGDVVATKESIGIRKDGSTVPLDVSIARFSIDGTDYLACIVRDVSARKLQEQRDQEHLDELAHVTRLHLMGEMVSGIAHEVNQPLTAIASYTQACLNIIQNERFDHVALGEILQKANYYALRAGQIIHRMRDFVKAKKMYRSTIDINDLIHDAIGLCEPYLKQDRIIVRLQLKKMLPIIDIDQVQIEQVVLNLIRNSIDALKNLPEIVPRYLSIQTTVNRANDIEIRVKDNGPGIDVAEQKKILTPFYTTKTEGMGMGLSISRSIIEAHDGVLRFNSQPGRGTTFYFTLPVRR